ncbi:hypothetical protein Goe17_01650 [Bacillus phage vB_BsuM-Goe17]|nr:hypothetical protein Goe17_01650 [Bacillus phage vB_BsuM-Goe17]
MNKSLIERVMDGKSLSVWDVEMAIECLSDFLDEALNEKHKDSAVEELRALIDVIDKALEQHGNDEYFID